MKNLLSENMLRFGTKNLSEAAQRELVLKSIMETINEHGLHNAVRQRLTEADAPSNKTYAFDDRTEFADAYKLGVKRGKEVGEFGDKDLGPLVYQSDTSVSEASTILSELFKVLGGSGTKDAQAVINVLKKINMNNYYAILWKVRYGSSFKANNRFKSNFNCLTDYISRIGIEIPSTMRPSTTDSDVNINPLGAIRNIFIDDTLYNWINSSMLPKYNSDEYISSTPKI